MKKSEKKEILLKILESLFDDRTKEVNNDNCISFYHFLLNTMEIDVNDIPLDEHTMFLLGHSIIHLLSRFDLLGIEPNHWNNTNTKNYLKGFSGLTEKEYISSISKFRKAYAIIKEEFFLSLS